MRDRAIQIPLYPPFSKGEVKVRTVKKKFSNALFEGPRFSVLLFAKHA
jgi:hypothetical protein